MRYAVSFGSVSQTVLCVGRAESIGTMRSSLDGEDPARLVTEQSVSAAKTLLEERPVDCVVADTELSEDDGMSVVTELRSVTADVPVVLFPANGSEQLAVRALRRDGVEYIPSDVEDRSERLSDCVKEVIETPQPVDADIRLRSFKRAVEQAGHSIYITDTDGTIRYVNPAFEATTGYTAEEAFGARPTMLKSGEHDETFYEDLWEAILSGEVWQSEIVNERKNGDRYVVNQTIAPIQVDGEIVRFVAVNADITDRRVWRRRLQTLHDATREWLELTSPDGISDRIRDQLDELVDAGLICVYCRSDEEETLVPAAWTANGAFEGTEPSPVESTADRRWRSFTIGSPQHRSDIEHATGGTEAVVGDELLLPVGNYGLIRVATEGPLDETDLGIARVFATNLEAVLERVENYQALERKNERLDQFAGVVSHDLRNPLSVALGYLDLLEERIGEDPDLQEIRRSLTHMDNIIDDVLWLASEGREIGDLREVSLREVAEESWALVDTAEATLQVPTDQTVDADPDRLHQLFENAFSNAVTHGGSDVTVTVGSLEDGEGFYVADDGSGIPPEEREAVLDPGYTTNEDGTGFGLPIVKRVVEGHGWSLRIGESADGGARLTVLL
jgi:PAS domain S-box-containing protein